MPKFCWVILRELSAFQESNLQSYINQEQQQIEDALGAIADLQQQVRVQQQVKQVQQTAEKEVKDWLNQGKKL
ncbi:MAG: hypothetical protein HC847_24325 [Hydrococcus sp. RU_2_2]|nr:hypothetical protein [Hydrococcus sp. RU_2_2]NJP19675.1 hypothetical protein [Hydrococcus sp. CRU_1_1]